MTSYLWFALGMLFGSAITHATQYWLRRKEKV